ncbi:MAG: tetratricopeptide repeat protein [Methylococcales bacterium]|nr:tetratricopeptide repeat protein [Methylococcaceae bacterium]
MKLSSHPKKQQLAAIILGLLSASQMLNAATYDLQDRQQNSFGNLEQLSPAPNEAGASSSVLESLQQAEVDKKKSDYLNVLGLLKQNKVVEAEKKIADLLKDSPNEAGFHNLQALLHVIKKESGPANESYQKAISLDPKNILAYLGIAKLALEENNFETVKEYSNKALGIDDKSINAYLLLADAALKQKNNAEVESIFANALQKVRGNVNTEAEVISNLGRYYAAQKQADKILPLAEDLSNRYPNDTKALDLLIAAQLANNKNDLAETNLRKIISNDKQDINHRLLLARVINGQTGKEKEILTLLDEASKIDSNNPEATIFKATYLIKLGRIKEALELANKLDVQFPKQPLGKILQGDAYIADKKLDKATDSYKKAYQLQAGDKTLFTIADLLIAQNKSADALKLLNAELAKNPKNRAIEFKLATIFQQQNDYKQAIVHYESILAQQAGNVLALNNLAWVYSQQNDPKAIEYGKKAFEIAPESAAIVDTYGYILIKQGQLTEGLKVLEKAASLAPKAYDIQYHLAEAYKANGNKQKAREILANITKTEQEFSEKKAALTLFQELNAE